MTNIVTICARGGSKGVPRKNIRPLLGKPLIGYTIEQAKACPNVDLVYVSTDDEEIAQIASSFGACVPFLRDPSLAQDDTPKLQVIKDLVDWVANSGVEIDKIIDLDPTSPLRDISDISNCISLLGNHDLVITAYEAEKNPYFNMVELTENGFANLVKPDKQPVVARQLAPKVFSMNGSVYVWRPSTLTANLWDGNVKLYAMPRERSIDIDSEIDFKLVELLMEQKIVAM